MERNVRKPPRHIPLTPEQLQARAVRRRDQRRALRQLALASGDDFRADLIFDNRAPHAYRGTPPRRHHDRTKDRVRSREAYRRAIQKTGDIGINPVMRGVCERGSSMHKAWLEKSKKWDAAHRVEADA